MLSLVSGWLVPVGLAAVVGIGLVLLLVLGLRVRRQVHALGAAVGTARDRLAAETAAMEQLATRRPRGR